jgi:hypothetical protein
MSRHELGFPPGGRILLRMEGTMEKFLHFQVFTLGIIFFLFPVTVLRSDTLAKPLPPATAVNHQIHQCAEILIPADECGHTILPQDWEWLKDGASCPDDYIFIDISADLGRAGIKDPACCYEMGLYGTHGDCQDIVIQSVKRQCAFVEDIQYCNSFPEGWKTWGKYCPDNYKWVDNVPCSPDIKPVIRKPLVPCLATGLILAFLLGVRLSRH